jgi:hypothetical protein
MSLESLEATQEYTLLIEFVHKHLDFHNAELLSILDMNGIRIGTDCHFRTLPIDDRSSEFRRPFKILLFPWNSVGGKFSVDDSDENTKRGKCINLVSALSRCTLIRGVLELWG